MFRQKCGLKHDVVRKAVCADGGGGRIERMKDNLK